ncbi:MAG: RNA polymerase sporulation sigma factor SigK [Clostridiales bacterium]|jgi:RNA polymerase sporulation-specific sigma factor|nr:RNA polymerase sporulation sigma factor SigK [Clostridiales bacterium]
MRDKFSSGMFPKPLSREEEIKYIRLYKEGTESEKKIAKDVLVERNLRLVAHIAKKYNSKENEDLISIGSIGLMKAVHSFDPEKAAKFSTYASRCIENEILMHLRSAGKTKGEISLYDPIGKDKEGNEITHEDRMFSEESSVEEQVELILQTEKLKKVFFEVLDEREQQIIAMRFGLTSAEELTQREVAEVLNISRSYVSRIEKKALKKIATEFKK